MSDRDLVYAKAAIPRALKRRLFMALVATDQNFSSWFRSKIEDWLEELEQNSMQTRPDHRNSTNGQFYYELLHNRSFDLDCLK